MIVVDTVVAEGVVAVDVAPHGQRPEHPAH